MALIKNMIMILIIVIVMTGCQPAVIYKVFDPVQIDINTYSNSLTDCQSELKQNLLIENDINFVKAECRICPEKTKLSPQTCYLGCGQTCPVGADCRYPDTCNGGCVGGNCDTTCHYFENCGCVGGNQQLTSYYLYMLPENEVNTEYQTRMDNDYNKMCLGIDNTSGNEPKIENFSIGKIGLILIALFAFWVWL